MEIWKDIKNFENKYQISNLGNVKSLERLIKPTGKYQKTKTCRERILKTCIGAHGYFHVGLEGKKYLIHKLIAIAFINNPNNLTCVNHKDGNKLNNSLNNLEWCDYKYNSNHMFNSGLRKDNIKIKVTILLDGTQIIFRSKTKAKQYLKLSDKKIEKALILGEIDGIKFEYA